MRTPNGWNRDPRRGWSFLPRVTGPDREAALRRMLASRRGDLYRLAFVMLAAWGLYSLVVSPHGLLRLTELRQREGDLAIKLVKLEDRAAELERRLDEPLPDREERDARERFRLGRKDEIIFFFERGQVPAADDSSTRGDQKPVDSPREEP